MPFFGLSLYVCRPDKRIMRKTYYKFAFAILTILLTACAKIGSPTGGPKDVTPPRVVETAPSDSTINFIPKKKITITFDEYIQLKNIFQELIISPPLEEKPMAYIKKKSLVIEFSDKAVFDTTTYTLSFGNSIADNNEGNVLKNYEFVFSLKNYIDSINLEGRVVNALNLTPDKERMFVMLYDNLNDSAPLKEKPKYISRTNEEGYFSIHNIQTGFYRLFALKDANSNLKYDLPDEQIAFFDTIINLTAERFKDTLVIDDYNLLGNQQNEFSRAEDTLIKDTLKHERKYLFYTEMVFFTQKVKNQYLTNSIRELPEQLLFTFNQTLEDSLKIRPINFIPKEKWYILDSNKGKDTLKYWLTDTALISKDSLKMELQFPVYDSTGSIKTSIDTVYLIKKADDQPKGIRIRRGRGRENEEGTKKKIKRLTFAINVKNTNAFDLNRNFELTTQTPAFNIKGEKIKMFKFEDTLKVSIKTEIRRDTNSMYKFIIVYKPEERTRYRIFIPDSTISDIYGTTNDTTIVQYTTQSEDFYGTLILSVHHVKGPVILQLLDSKEKLVIEKHISEDQTITYDYLYPQKYILKLIVDSNGNGKWDTGNYLKKLQPEKVIYYPQIINIRSNWEIDNSWELHY